MITVSIREYKPTDAVRRAIEILTERPEVLVYADNMTPEQIRGAFCVLGKSGIYRTSSYREGCYISRNDNSK